MNLPALVQQLETATETETEIVVMAAEEGIASGTSIIVAQVVCTFESLTATQGDAKRRTQM